MTKIDFTKTVNKLRLDNRDKWVFYSAVINGVTVDYKAFNTWVQLLKFDDINYASTIGFSVGDYKEFLRDTLVNIDGL